jgi:protease-4
MRTLRTIARVGVVLFGGAIAAGVAWLLFVVVPDRPVELVGVLLVVGAAAIGIRVGSNVGNTLFADYNVAEVAVEGPITRDGGGGTPLSAPGTPGADEIVDLVETADGDDNADALLLRLNTPGGAVVPSDDIRLAAQEFDGPTVAYATDTCASGGYWIASGCDELWCRTGSIVGSVGVRGSRATASELLEKVGLEYEQLTAGAYKEAGVPFKDLEDDERDYLQGIVDGYYDQFVETAAAGRDIDAETLRDTEAKVFLGEDAREMGLVDELGTRDDVEARLEEQLEAPVETVELEPTRSVTERFRAGAERTAYAFGAGLAGRLVDADGEFRFRL